MEIPEETPEMREKKLLNRFCRSQKCTREEARFYLEEHEWDYKAATTARTDDVEWEKSHPRKK